MRIPALFALFALSWALLPVGAAADEDAARRYAACMDRVEARPGQAFEDATAWYGVGGGAPAQHCAAAALRALGQPAEAARRLEYLAQEIRAEPAFKARALTQAAQAWQDAGDPARAEAALTAALDLVPEDPDLLLERAAVRADRGDYKAALADLDRVLARQPTRVEAWAYRAAAHRYLDDLEAAAGDLAQALSLDPDHPEALLERGNLRRLRGDTAGARQDWLDLLAVAPDSPAAEAARANLERLDVRPAD